MDKTSIEPNNGDDDNKHVKKPGQPALPAGGRDWLETPTDTDIALAKEVLDKVRNTADPVASSLFEAASRNNVTLCEKAYGHAESGNIFVNARGLRIAAENKSYEALEHMLQISAKNDCGVTSAYSIGLGPDWDQVKQIARTDLRIRAALQRYEQQIDSNIRDLFRSADGAGQSETEDKGSRLKRAFQWAAAIVAPFGIEAPQRAFVQAGQAWDYTKAKIGAIVHRKPKIG